MVLITGSPGGRTIINTVLGIVLGVAEFDLAPVQAVAGARMHHQWFPDQLDLEDLENPPHSRIRSQLSNMGHTLGNRPKQGSAHTIAIDVESGGRPGCGQRRGDSLPTRLLRQCDKTTQIFTSTQNNDERLLVEGASYGYQWSTR